MKRGAGVWAIMLVTCVVCFGQVDTSYVYNTSTPYGTLDIRLAKSATRYYYLQENKTVSFRANSGAKTNSYLDMTSWDSSPYTQGNLREKSGSADYFIMNYRLLFPVSYSASYAEGYPLTIMMHGAGERGNCWNNTCYHADRTWKPQSNTPPAPADANSKLLNNDHNLLHGGKVHLDARNLAGSKLPSDPTLSGRAYPGFVLFPQNLNGWDGNSVQDAIKLIRLVAKKYNINEDRIYIHGLSNGGGAVYQALKRAPWLFAAALTMSASDDGGITSKNLQATIAHIPLWTFQGGMDTNPTKARTEGYVKKFREAGAVVRYSLYPELGHGTWNTAYKEPDFFKWILSKNKSDIHVFGGSTAICLTNKQGVRMQLAPGFRSYQWQKNGVTISGANSASYVATTTGSYRARFSRKANPGSSDWNQWSKTVIVTQQSPPQPQIVQIGTVLLKDLNNYGNLRLQSGTEAASYYWYKNGALVNLNGNLDDTTRHPIISPGTCNGTCTGNGKYTLVTKGVDGCPSPVSKQVSVYFNNQAPINIPAPGTFAGQITSLTTVKLSWKDLSSNEVGFEIWRRQATGTTYSKWEMRKITSPNATSFTDTGLEPSTRYHYKIRAAGTSGRSNYTPSASNSFLTITTNGDNTNPAVPQTLTARTTGINTIELSWKPSTDNTGIRQYRIYYGSRNIPTGSTSAKYILSDLNLNNVYSFTVRAEDLAGNLSGASNTATAHTYVSGLYYAHTTGSWTSLNQINWSAAPEFSGTVKNFSLTPRTQEDYFNFQYDGYLYITKSGVYKFRTISSDGSRLQINSTIVVNNDGIHSNRTITSANQTLGSGPHKINVKYFEYDESQTMVVQYYGPDTGSKWINIPDAALKSGTPPGSSQITAASLEEAVVVTDDSLYLRDDQVTVYPNPTNADNINIKIDTQHSVPVQIILMDFTGREVFNGNFDTAELQEGLRVTPSRSIDRGMYLLIINQGTRVTKQRLSITD